MTDSRPVLFEPASAIAAGICVTARTIAEGRTARHPRPCGWCDYPLDVLQRMVEGFNAWADPHPRTGAYRRFDANVFQGLPAREQAALVLAAQAFPPPAEPMAAVEPPPAHEPDEEGPKWLRQREGGVGTGRPPAGIHQPPVDAPAKSGIS